MKKINILLTAGVGSRLWPLFKKSRPKQYVPIFGDRLLFQLSTLRNIAVTDELVVICNEGNVDISRSNLEYVKVSANEWFVEFEARNTAETVTLGILECNEEPRAPSWMYENDLE